MCLQISLTALRSSQETYCAIAGDGELPSPKRGENLENVAQRDFHFPKVCHRLQNRPVWTCGVVVDLILKSANLFIGTYLQDPQGTHLVALAHAHLWQTFSTTRRSFYEGETVNQGEK